MTSVALVCVTAAAVPVLTASAAEDDGFFYRFRYTAPTTVDCVTSPITGLDIDNGITEFNYPDGAVLRQSHSPELGASEQTLSPANSGSGTFGQNYQSVTFSFPQTFVFTIELLVNDVATYREIVTFDCPSAGPATVTQTEDFLVPADPVPASTVLDPAAPVAAQPRTTG